MFDFGSLGPPYKQPLAVDSSQICKEHNATFLYCQDDSEAVFSP